MNVAKKPHKPLKSWLNRSNLIVSLGISGSAFDNWNVEPVARIGREAFFTVADVLKNRLDRQAELLGRSDDGDAAASAEQQAEKTRLIVEQRVAQQLKNEQARRELAPVSLSAGRFPKSVRRSQRSWNRYHFESKPSPRELPRPSSKWFVARSSKRRTQPRTCKSTLTSTTAPIPAPHRRKTIPRRARSFADAHSDRNPPIHRRDPR